MIVLRVTGIVAPEHIRIVCGILVLGRIGAAVVHGMSGGFVRITAVIAVPVMETMSAIPYATQALSVINTATNAMLKEQHVVIGAVVQQHAEAVLKHKIVTTPVTTGLTPKIAIPNPAVMPILLLGTPGVLVPLLAAQALKPEQVRTTAEVLIQIPEAVLTHQAAARLRIAV